MSVKKRPDGAWRARYYDAAGREHSKHFPRKVDAEAWERDQRAAVARGTHVDPRAGRETVRVYGERWRLAQVQHRPRTARQVESVTRLHVYPTIGDHRMSSIRRTAVQSLVTSWAASAAPRTVIMRYAFIRAMFASAVDDGVIGKSPCVRIKLPEVVDAAVVPLTVVQVRALHEAIAVPFRPGILVGAGCGLRVSEVLGLTAQAVRHLARDLDVRWQLSEAPPWELVPVKSKNGVREVPAPGFVLDALSTLTAGEMLGTLLHRGGDEGEPVSARMVHIAFADAVKVVNAAAAERKRDRKARRTTSPELPSIPADTTFHDLRHHYASTLIDGGESVTVVAARLGNDPGETLRTYAHLFPDSAARTRRIVDAAWSLQDHADGLRTVGE
ncbi:tyrosine-type recombinase/integrase [Candidatus Frankia nodulisporulans]|uniref:tyrosine-type recombinase/integrase n=1 Tax=Candidatus Frankia nodulisporulans TaxID=2060052 RepID=UPI0013D20FAE|nr:tyrosine-type recombinase/integrase [Candidatus Frankia nodulisporulans]